MQKKIKINYWQWKGKHWAITKGLMRGVLVTADLKSAKNRDSDNTIWESISESNGPRLKKRKFVVVICGTALMEVEGMAPSTGSDGVGVVLAHLHSNQLVHNLLEH